MSDQLEGLQGTGEGQPLPASGEAAAQSQPAYITQEALDAALAKVEANIARVVQSQTDRSVGGLKKIVDKKLKEFDDFASGAGVPQQVVDMEKARIWQESLDEFRSQGGVTPQPQEDVTTQINNWIFEIADELGVAPLYPKDPEFNTVNFNDPNPVNFKAQYEAAIRAKAGRRKGAQPEQAAQPTEQVQPQSRLPMVGGGQAAGNPTLEQLTTQLRTLQQKPVRTQADWARMRDLEAAITAQIPKR